MPEDNKNDVKGKHMGYYANTNKPGNANSDKDTGNAIVDMAEKANKAAGDSTQAGENKAAESGAKAGGETAAPDSAKTEEKTKDAKSAQTEEKTSAKDDAETEDGAKDVDASNATEGEAATVDTNGVGEIEATPTPGTTEAIVSPEPDSPPSQGLGNAWIAIVAGLLVVLIAAALLLKRFVYDRKEAKEGNASQAPQSPGDAENVNRGRHVARAERPIGSVRATMSADGPQGQFRYSVGYAQWIGRREDQEDALMVSEWKNANVVENRGILAAVADGIGGLDDGQVASQTLMRSFEDGFEQLDPGMSPQGKLLELTAQGQSEVLDINRRGQRCGTTLVAVLIQEGYLSAISVGDSRIDLYRSGVLLQLNREHVNARVRDEESAFDGAPPVEGRRRAALTSYIGKEDLRELDRTLNPIQLVSGDRVLLMSDGVFGTLSDEQLVALLEQDAQKAADSIIKQVQMQKNQYQDNATVVVVEVK